MYISIFFNYLQVALVRFSTEKGILVVPLFHAKLIYFVEESTLNSAGKKFMLIWTLLTFKDENS